MEEVASHNSSAVVKPRPTISDLARPNVCKGITRDGTRCLTPPKRGIDYCVHHDPAPKVTCSAITVDGSRCRMSPQAGKEICMHHDPDRRAEVVAKCKAATKATKLSTKVKDRNALQRKGSNLPRGFVMPAKFESAADVVDLLHTIIVRTAAGDIDPKTCAALSQTCRTVLTALEIRSKRGGTRKMKIHFKPKSIPGAPATQALEVAGAELEIEAPIDIPLPEEIIILEDSEDAG